MKKKVIKVLIGVTVGLLIMGIFCFRYNRNKPSEERIKNLEKATNVTITLDSDMVSNPKETNITDEEDKKELIQIFNNARLEKIVTTGSPLDYYIPKIIFYDSSNNKMTEILLYYSGVMAGNKTINVASKDLEKVRKIINKYFNKDYGKITCQDDKKTDIYYLYDNKVIKYLKIISDYGTLDEIDEFKAKVDKSESMEYYDAFLIYNNQTYGNFPGESIVLKGDYYFSETYLINKMTNKELKDLLNMSKSDFKNKKVYDIANKYKDNACKVSVFN